METKSATPVAYPHGVRIALQAKVMGGTRVAERMRASGEFWQVHHGYDDNVYANMAVPDGKDARAWARQILLYVLGYCVESTLEIVGPLGRGGRGVQR